MDRQGRTQLDWNLVTTLLLRQFAARSAVALLIAGLGLLAATRHALLVLGLVVGGGWMVANCIVVVWMGAQAIRHGQAQQGRYAFGFTAAILASLALGGWLAAVCWSVWPGLALGLTIPLAAFMVQLRRLKCKLEPNAR